MRSSADGIVEDAIFPPPYSVFRLRERDSAFAVALERAREEGAGALFHVGRFDVVEFSVVLEPEEPLRAARRVLFAGLNAIADAIAANSPPEKPVTFRYPDTLLFDGGLVGGGQIGWPEGTPEDAVPEWIVFAGMVRTGGFQELGFRLSTGATTLEEEGYGPIVPAAFVASFARHLMVEFDEWHEQGFNGIARRYLERLERLPEQGRRGIDVNGDLLIHAQADTRSAPGVTRTALLPMLQTPSWLDRETGMPLA